MAPEQLGVALDPFRPTEVVTAPGTLPQCCPLCRGRLQDVRYNDKGDAQYECMNDGYEAVYRVAPDDQQRRTVPRNHPGAIECLGPWEPYPRPGVASYRDWRPPLPSPDSQPPAPAPGPAAAIETPARSRTRARRAPAPAAVGSTEIETASPPPPRPSATEPAATEGLDLEWVTLADAAEMTGSKPDAIYRRVRRGTLDAKRGLDGKVFVRADQLLDGAGD